MLKIHDFFRLCLPAHPPPPPFRQYKLALAWDPGGLDPKIYILWWSSNSRSDFGTFRGFGTERARLGTFRGFGTERERLGTFRGFGTERARLGTFRGFGTERARLGTFRGLGTERARLGTFNQNLRFPTFSKKSQKNVIFLLKKRTQPRKNWSLTWKYLSILIQKDYPASKKNWIFAWKNDKKSTKKW